MACRPRRICLGPVRGDAALVRGLRDLPRSDLETLLIRRPEAATLAVSSTRSPPSFGALARVLAAPEGVREAVEGLDRFLTQLLELAVWFAPRADRAALAAQAPGVDEAVLIAGMQELARRGLAFPGGDSPQWWIEVPDSVAAAVPSPGGLGPRVIRLFGGRTPQTLAVIAGNVGVPAGGRPTGSILLDRIAARLAEPATVAGLVDRAPSTARSILTIFRASGGRLHWDEMIGIPFLSSWDGQGQPRSGLAWLQAHGLLAGDAATPWTAGSGICIPAEVELAMRAGRIFERWDPEGPPLQIVQPTGNGSRATLPAADPSTVLADVQALLDEWSERPPRRLQRGGLGVRELRRAAKFLGAEERRAGFLYALMVEAGLVEYEGDAVVPSSGAGAWADLSSPRQWESLFDAWRDGRLWSEPSGGLLPIEDVPYRPTSSQRSAALTALAEVPQAQTAEAASMADVLTWRHPHLFHCTECARAVVDRVAEALAWLGTGSAGPAVGIFDPARSVISDSDWISSSSGPAHLFPPTVATCTIGADLHVIVPGRPARELATGLARFADLQRSSPARLYRISETSLRRALDSGMKTAEIRALLERHAPRGVPQSVAYLIEDLGRRHGRLVAGKAGLYVRSEDRALIACLIADRRLALLQPRLLAPTVVVVAGSSVSKLLAELRAAGYMPVAEAGGVDLDEDAPRRRRSRILPRRPDRPDACRLTATQAAEIAEALAHDAVPADKGARRESYPVGEDLLEGKTYQSRRQIRRLAEVAAEQRRAIEIRYSSGRKDTVRTIEPLEVDHSTVTGWCRLRDDLRTFYLARILWARATGDLATGLMEGGRP